MASDLAGFVAINVAILAELIYDDFLRLDRPVDNQYQNWPKTFKKCQNRGPKNGYFEGVP